MTLAQLKRYMAGQPMPDELLDQLERHLQACPDCLVEARRLRRQMGGGESPVTEAKPSPMAAVMQQVRRTVERPTPATLLDPPGTDGMPPSLIEVLKQPRHLALSLALAVVLVLMSTVFRDPTSLLGRRAAPAGQAEHASAAQDDGLEKGAVAEGQRDAADHRQDHGRSKTDEEAQPANAGHSEPGLEHEEAPTGGPVDHRSVADRKAAGIKPPLESPPLGGKILIADSSTAPKAKAPRSAASSRPKARPARRKAPSAPVTRIRVYDESGRPKNATP